MSPSYYSAEQLEATELIAAPIADGSAASYFRVGDKLTILDAHLTGVHHPERSTLDVAIKVKNQRSLIVAWTDVEVDVADLTPSKILRDVMTGWFSPRDMSGGPRVGSMARDVYCALGYPERRNTDAIDGDQLIYFGGRELVYVDSSDRVVDIQTFD